MFSFKLMVRALTGGMPNALKEEVECQNILINRILICKIGGNHVQ